MELISLGVLVLLYVLSGLDIRRGPEANWGLWFLKK